eukprot:1219827-Alexandrium_andersonii.AAC.1
MCIRDRPDAGRVHQRRQGRALLRADGHARHGQLVPARGWSVLLAGQWRRRVAGAARAQAGAPGT